VCIVIASSHMKAVRRAQGISLGRQPTWQRRRVVKPCSRVRALVYPSDRSGRRIDRIIDLLPFHPGITTVLARFRVGVRISDAEYRNAGGHSPPRRGTGTLVEQSPMKFTVHFVYADCLQSTH
jgi:hypothetical protein